MKLEDKVAIGMFVFMLLFVTGLVCYYAGGFPVDVELARAMPFISGLLIGLNTGVTFGIIVARVNKKDKEKKSDD